MIVLSDSIEVHPVDWDDSTGLAESVLEINTPSSADEGYYFCDMTYGDEDAGTATFPSTHGALYSTCIFSHHFVSFPQIFKAIVIWKNHNFLP